MLLEKHISIMLSLSPNSRSIAAHGCYFGKISLSPPAGLKTFPANPGNQSQVIMFYHKEFYKATPTYPPVSTGDTTLTKGGSKGKLS